MAPLSVPPFQAAALAVVTLAASTTSWAAARAQDATAVRVELNKLEPLDRSCRAYLVIDNAAPLDYDALKLDLFMFRTDGIIGRRFAVDLGPLKGAKRTVKLFDLAGTGCDDVGSFLINDVLECRVGGTAAADCLARLAPASLAAARLTK